MKNIIEIIKNNKLASLLILFVIILLIGIAFLYPNNQEEPSKEYILELIGKDEITINQGDEFIEPGYLAYYGDIDVTNQVIVSGNVDIYNAGIYKIIYRIHDKTLVRIINVVENEEEREIVFELIGEEKITLLLNEEYKEPGFIANSGKDINLLNEVVVDGLVNTEKAGTYIITYKLKYFDKVYELKREVKVIEPTKLEVTYDSKNYQKEIDVFVNVVGSEYKCIRLPNGIVSYEKNINYKIKENGTYKFSVYNHNGEVIEKNINVTNIDNNIDSASCTLNVKVKSSSIVVNAYDKSGISNYIYNNSSYTTNTINLKSKVKSASVTVYDKIGNSKQINCSVSVLEEIYGFILIGDSRFAAMETYLGNDKRDNDIIIAKVSMGYNWLLNTAIDKVNDILKKNPNRKYYILSNLGVNDYTYRDDLEYAIKLNELANTDWKEHIVGYISVNPYANINESRNSNIVKFNNEQKKALNGVYYCDTYNGIGLSNFEPVKSSDTLHYNKKTSINIYNYIINNCAF